jgi:hypothetical protein
MPWYAWYLIIGFVWLLTRFAIALVSVVLLPAVRDQVKLTVSSYVTSMLVWPLDALYVVIGITWILVKFWFGYRLAMRMKAAGLE